MIRPKGLPFDHASDVGWNIFDDAMAYPVAVLLDSALDHNSATMMSYCRRHGVSLAPHGKTTMAPALFRRQLDDGAWAITAATTWQARTMRHAGVERVLIANEVVVPGELAWLATAIDEGFDAYCYVDSLEGVEIMSDALSGMGTDRRLPVLLELGVAGGRTGARTIEYGLEVAEAVASSPRLVLAGTAGFEGIIGHEEGRPAGEAVDEFLDGIVELTHAVHARGWFEPSPEVIVSAGGSAYFDHVVDRFSRIDIDAPVRVVIRSGCYLTHDDGGYHRSSPLGENLRIDATPLVPAIEVWGTVLSRPEPNRVLVSLGKRDASHDGLLPLAKKVLRRGASRVEEIEPMRVAVMNDQHSYLVVDPADPLAVGDLVGFGISHPCTFFDKWRALAVVDDEYRVTEVVETYF